MDNRSTSEEKDINIKKASHSMKTFSKFMVECSQIDEGGLSRAISKSDTHDSGHISADRGSDESANRKKRKKLEGKLKKKGIGYKKSTGSYKYDDGSTGREVSYHTTKPEGMSKRKFGKTMRRAGKEAGQETVITKKAGKPARLHDTQSKKPGKSANIGKKAKVGAHPDGEGETGETRTRGSKLSNPKNKDRKFHYGN